MVEEYDLVVVGGGSGGIGAALAGARNGLSTLVVEQADRLGGNAVRGGVHDWEQSVGGTGIPFEIYCRLHEYADDAVGIASYSDGRHILLGDDHPGGEKRIDTTRTYRETLQRHRGDAPVSWEDSPEFIRTHWNGVVFEPDAYTDVVEAMVAETGQCTVLTKTAFTDVVTDDGVLERIVVDDGRGFRAETFVDSTASGALCRACGCEAMMGRESRDRFDEPHAPAEPTDDINAATLIYRISRRDDSTPVPVPADVSAEPWWRDTFPGARLTEYPCGDFNVNMLPTMEGREFLRLKDEEGYEAAYSEAKRRVFAHWQHLRATYPRFQEYDINWIAPAMGVRESYRIKGEYVLTEHDVVGGLSDQSHEDIVTIVDHPPDWHSKEDSDGVETLTAVKPYGVPYRCLLPEGTENVLIACRGASFSSIAGSSCRLSRTMLQLGQAAGTAAAIAAARDCRLRQVPAERLRAALREQHVELSWPRPDDLEEYLDARDPAA